VARRKGRTPPPGPERDPLRDLAAGHGSPVPEAMPGPRTPRDRALALTVAASFLVAASSLGMGRSPAPPRAPDCAPGRPGEVSFDPDGCWEQRDGSRQFRTVSSTGARTYHASPPAQSRYYESPRSRWSFWGSSSSSSSSGSSYRSSGSSSSGG
jgi:hypothetical protein